MAVRGGVDGGVLSPTSDDSSSELLVQKVVDVICAMDGRHILLKPPYPRRDRQMEIQTDRWMNGQTDRQMDNWTDGRIDGCTDGQTDRQRRTNGWMDGWTG